MACASWNLDNYSIQALAKATTIFATLQRRKGKLETKYKTAKLEQNRKEARESMLINQSNRKPLRFVSFVAILVLILGFVAAIASIAPTTQAASWNLQWSDEFNGAAGTGVNPSNWFYDTGQGVFGTGEIENMTNSTNNVYQDGNGHLVLKAINNGGQWTSGRVETQLSNFAAPAGGVLAVEASIQQPNLSGAAAAGYWPAFWMLGSTLRTGGSWPSVGEIDILEDINGRSSVFGTMHCGVNPGGPCNESTGIGSGEHACPGCQTAFHTYRMEYDKSVSPEQIRWYLDGVNYFTINSTQVDATTWANATNHAFFVILDLAMGGGFPAAFGGGPTSSTVSGGMMLIDYVRVYTSNGTPTTTPPTTTPVSGTNIALNKTATSSSNENAGTTANLAVDGNTGTRWSSAFSDPQWLQVDLGSSYNVNKVVLNWEAAYGKAYQIQTSNDGTNWTSIYNTTTGAGGVETLNVNGTGRYIRMYGTARGTAYGYSLWEFQVFGTPSNTTTNLALNKTATSSSNENAGTTANLAVDGNTGTRWSSAFADPQWLQVDLGATHTISQVVLNWEAAYGKAYQIQTSNDGTNWTTIYSTTTGAGGTETLNVSGSGRYVRMYGTARGTVYGYSLWEFGVYGS
jgi:hypothetical protein